MDKKRLITGLCLGVLCTVSVFCFSSVFFAALLAVVLLLAAWEYAAFLSPYWLVKLLYLLLLAVAGALVMPYMHMVLLMAVCFWIVAFILLLLPFESVGFLKHPLVVALCGFLMLVPPFIAGYALHQIPIMLYGLILYVGFYDTGAYYVGTAYGKHRLAPVLSPKKSYEGLVGGLVVSLVIGTLWYVCLAKSIAPSLYAYWAIGLLAMLSATLGDLFESALKRLFKIKDSGTLLPGHGGMLDRFDSLLAALPVITWLCLYVIHLK